MLRPMIRLVLVLLLLQAGVAIAGAPLPGKSPAELFAGARFDSGIPTQSEMFGFDPGGRPLRHGELMAYLRALDAASDRARLEVYARSHEGRELVVFAVSDEATIADLDAFREEHARRVDPRGRPATEDSPLFDQAKAVAWMAYSIHGDELSSADAAAALAYWLVAGEDELATKLRRELVILIDPCENPDGRDRFLAQTASFAHRVPNPDTEDLSHTTVWPWGRGNHYLFDLNRDWFSMVHPESERSAVIASWNPQLMVDSHEMGADDTYLLPPPRQPFNPWLPESQQRWLERYSADQSRALDRFDFPYYTREWNEEFFPGYGSSWASYYGAVGILYEMSSTEGTLVRKRDGSTRSYAEAVQHHVVSSVANLTTTAENRGELLADYVAQRRRSIARAGKEWPAAWILPRGDRPERTDRLVQLLRRQGIEVQRNAGGRPQIAGLRDARTGESVPAERLADEVYLVSLDQPAGPLVRQLLDPHIPMDSRFFREEREYLERGKGSRLYEVTSWSLPLAFDVEAYWTDSRPSGEFVDATLPPVEGGFEGAGERVGYVIEGSSDRSLPVLAELLQRGLAVRIAEKEFEVDGRAYPRSSLLLEEEGSPDDLESVLRDIAQRGEVIVRTVSTSRASGGPDLGGRHFKPLIAPRVGIWSGWPVSPTSYGALWHLFDEEIRLRFNGLDLGRFSSIDLRRYNALIFPPVRGSYRAVVGESGRAALSTWIEAGGTAIGIGNGAEFLADVEYGLTQARLRRQAVERFPPVVYGPGPERVELAGPFRAAGLRAPGKEKKDKDGADEEGRSKRRREVDPEDGERSPYDVAPVLGPGARPFARGFDQGSAPGEPIDLADWLHPLLPPGQPKPTKEDLERADRRLLRFSPRGAFVRIELDRDHWLNWGAPPELPALVRARDTLVAESPVQVAARFAGLDRLHLGGLLWPEAAGRMAHTAYATREGKGRGQVILFLNEPEFRGWTLGTRRLLVNAVLYGPGLGTRWSNPW